MGYLTSALSFLTCKIELIVLPLYSCSLSLSQTHLVVSDSATLWTVAQLSPLPMEFSWREYWNADCHSFLQGIFPTQGSNLAFLHWRQISHILATREAHYLVVTGIKQFLIHSMYVV